jgi:hypothetical protein
MQDSTVLPLDPQTELEAYSLSEPCLNTSKAAKFHKKVDISWCKNYN